MGSGFRNNTPRETWVALTIMAVIILYSTVLTLYLAVAGRLTPTLPVLAGNATVSQGGVLKVTVMAFGVTYRITGITPLGGACRLTGVSINNTQAPLTPPWILRSGQSAVFILSGCVNVSQVIVHYDNGRVLAIPVRG
jgi:hypothetical protein